MATAPTPLVVPNLLTGLPDLRTWLAANCESKTLANQILGLIDYEFDLIIKLVLVRPTTLPYTSGSTTIPGRQGRVDILVSDGQDADCLYQRIVLDSAFNMTNTQELIVDISSLTPQ